MAPFPVSAWWHVATVALSLAVLGCGPALAMRVSNIHVVPSQLSAMPAMVEISELDARQTWTPREDWTSAATVNVDAAVDYVVAANEGDSFDAGDVANTEIPYGAFRRWSKLALTQIAAELDGSQRLSHRSISEWRFDYDLRSWRHRLQSDFVLVVLFRDAHNTVGHVLVNALTPIFLRVYAQQVGIACVVDLRDGRIVWCESYVDPGGDLRDRLGATRAVNRLLRPLLPRNSEVPPFPGTSNNPRR
jgi:hypothetical protein